MGLLLLVAIGWALCHIFEGKAAEYRTAQDRYRKQLNKELKSRHPSWDKSRRARALWWGARRNALGHFAYQLRHGWSPTVADMRDGFVAAKKQHQEWQERRAATGEPVPPLRNAIRAGWERAKAKFRRGAAAEASEPEPTTPTPKPEEPTSRVRGAAVLRAVPAGAGSESPTGKETTVTDTMTGETTNIGTYRTHLDATISAAAGRIEEARAEIAAADKEIAAHESTNTSLLNAGLGSETAGGMTDLMDAAMQRRTAATQRLQAAEQTVANAEAARTKLRTQGHENVEQSVQGATAKVGDTSFYSG